VGSLGPEGWGGSCAGPTHRTGGGGLFKFSSCARRRPSSCARTVRLQRSGCCPPRSAPPLTTRPLLSGSNALAVTHCQQTGADLVPPSPPRTPQHARAFCPAPRPVLLLSLLEKKGIDWPKGGGALAAGDDFELCLVVDLGDTGRCIATKKGTKVTITH
jgi:hypothetical protein